MQSTKPCVKSTMSWTELAVTPHHLADRQTHLIAILARTVMSDLYCVCDISDSPCSIQWCQSDPRLQQEYCPCASCTRRHYQHQSYFMFCLHPWCQKLSLTCHYQRPLCPVQSHPSVTGLMHTNTQAAKWTSVEVVICHSKEPLSIMHTNNIK